jgi:CCR4-NOT transcription complex subunit 2
MSLAVAASSQTAPRTFRDATACLLHHFNLDLDYLLHLRHITSKLLHCTYSMPKPSYKRLILDGYDREFPSLSGAPQQAQTQIPGHAVWGQRTAQPTPAQRQQQVSTQTQPTPSQPTQGQPQPPSQQSSHDDVFPSAGQFSSGIDDFRHGTQGMSGQMSATSQPQTGSIDEFPPLGRNISGELGQERRGSIMQGTGFGAYGSSIGFGAALSQTQSRNGMSNQLNGQQDGSRVSSQTAGGVGGKKTHRRISEP